MASYLLAETRGPWHGPAGQRFFADAAVLLGAGHQVCVLLMEDAVAAALPQAPAALVRAGAQVWVDRYGLAQRGMLGTPLAGGVRIVELDDVAELLLDPRTRVVWH